MPFVDTVSKMEREERSFAPPNMAVQEYGVEATLLKVRLYIFYKQGRGDAPVSR